MSQSAAYELPTGVVGLKGPIDRPAPGTLPLRGDLAHIALAHRYLAAHYVVPQSRKVGPEGAILLHQPQDDSDGGARVAPGDPVEILDMAGDWYWVCVGPDGPSGYLRSAALADEDAA